MAKVIEEAARAAQRLKIEAALLLTRLKRPMKRAVMLVMVEGLTPSEAARKVKKPRQFVYRALRVVGPKLKAVQDYMDATP